MQDIELGFKGMTSMELVGVDLKTVEQAKRESMTASEARAATSSS